MKRLALAISLLLLADGAHAQKLERINPNGLFKNPNYTQVVKAGKLLFIAGQVGVAADGKIVGPGMKEQMEQVLTNLETALKSQGADLSHIAKMTTYVTSMAEFRAPDLLAYRTQRFRGLPPASTLVEVVHLADPAYKVEIEVIAVLP